MPEIERSDRFDRRFRAKPPDQQAAILKAIKLLADNPRHRSLRVKRMKSAPGVWEASVTRSDRMTFERQGDSITLRFNCHHDDTLRRP